MSSASRRREIEDAISTELNRFPVLFGFDRGNDGHPFVWIEAASGERRKKFYPASSSDVKAVLAVKTQVRRIVTQDLQVAPYPEERANTRMGTLGAKLAEAAAPPPEPTPTPASVPRTLPDLSQRTAPMSASSTAPRTNEPPIKTKRAYVKMSPTDIAQATMLITSNAKVDWNAKRVDYADGWGDQRIAAILAMTAGREGISETHIKALRRAAIGLTEKERTRAPVAVGDMPAAIAEMDDRIRTLDERIAAVEDLLTKAGA